MKKILDGNIHFKDGERELGPTIGDFWAWAMSRLMADGPRGDLAEFIVNTALGSDMTIPKKGWGECDILYRGKRVEVKCSSVLQEWVRDTPSRPVFSIAKTLACDCVEQSDGNYIYQKRPDDDFPQRRSEVYVFCLFSESDRQRADPADFSQWQFYIVLTAVLNERLGDQRQISLQGLERIGAFKCSYSGLKASVDKVLMLE